MVRASEAMKAPKMPKPVKGPPIRASQLQQRRHEKALADLERAVTRREKAFEALMRAHSAIHKIARVLKRYEKLKLN